MLKFFPLIYSYSVRHVYTPCNVDCTWLIRFMLYTFHVNLQNANPFHTVFIYRTQRSNNVYDGAKEHTWFSDRLGRYQRYNLGHKVTGCKDAFMVRIYDFFLYFQLPCHVKAEFWLNFHHFSSFIKLNDSFDKNFLWYLTIQKDVKIITVFLKHAYVCCY